MLISEIFSSIQGEGVNLGKPTIFIRTAGCNLQCTFCDSKYAFKGDPWEISKILGEVHKFDCKNICITGGEPLLQETYFGELIKALFFAGYLIEVETNGTIFPKDAINIFGIQWNVSPKLSNSGNDLDVSRNRNVLAAFNILPKVAFKFVVSEEKDLLEVNDLVKSLNLKHVYLMPEGIEDVKIKETGKWLVDKCKEFSYSFSPRFHIWLWGSKRGV